MRWVRSFFWEPWPRPPRDAQAARFKWVYGPWLLGLGGGVLLAEVTHAQWVDKTVLVGIPVIAVISLTAMFKTYEW